MDSFLTEAVLAAPPAEWDVTCIIIRPRRSRSAAAYSDQTFPCTIVGPCVSSVGLSSALLTNGGSDPDAVWHRKSDRSRDEAGSGYRFTGRGTFGGEFRARHCNQWGLYGVRVRQCRDAALFPNYLIVAVLVLVRWSCSLAAELSSVTIALSARVQKETNIVIPLS